MNQVHQQTPTGAARGKGGPTLSPEERELATEFEEVLKETGCTKVLEKSWAGIYASCIFGWYGKHSHYLVEDEKGIRYNYCRRTGWMHYLQGMRR